MYKICSYWEEAAVWHRELSSVLCDDLEGWGGVRIWAPLVAQMVKNPPAMRETWVRSWGPEDPLEKGMATDSSMLAWRIPWTEEPGRLRSMRSQRAGLHWSNSACMQPCWFSFPGSSSVLHPVSLGLGTELSMWSSFFPSDGGPLTV